jgi:RNA polymerase sigma-70 factor (ECF subfamily)
MHERDWLAKRFDQNRRHLRAVAYRMLGSLSEAEDAIQEAWLRLDRSETRDIANLRGWLTTVVGRVCLDMLRARKLRREESQGSPEPILAGPSDPEQESLVADSVGLALLVVLETLTPAERIAFVLHDMFGVPFDEIAPMVGRSLPAAKQLASRARRRVQGATTVHADDRRREREVLEAFLAALRGGDFDALLSVLDPDVVARAGEIVVEGASAVAKRALIFSRAGVQFARLALVNGAAGLVVAPCGRLTTVLSFNITDGKIVAIEIIGDPRRFHELDLGLIDSWRNGGALDLDDDEASE